jgi:HAD superfamily hydrolase (TIGR01509 family)
VVFDMDGLMVNSEPLSRHAWDQVLGRYGHRLDDATYGRMVGRRTTESAKLVTEAYDLPLSIADLAAEKTRVWETIWRNGVPAMPGLDLLQRELARRGLPWAVATSSPRRYAQHVLRQLGMDTRCRALVGGDEVTQGKPAPDIYLLAAERLGVSAGRCLALEDSVPGGRAAQAAGMLLVAVPGFPATAADFDFADHIIPSLTQVALDLEQLLAG